MLVCAARRNPGLNGRPVAVVGDPVGRREAQAIGPGLTVLPANHRPCWEPWKP